LVDAGGGGADQFAHGQQRSAADQQPLAAEEVTQQAEGQLQYGDWEEEGRRRSR